MRVLQVLALFVGSGAIVASLIHNQWREVGRRGSLLAALSDPNILSRGTPPTDAPSGNYAPSNLSCPPQLVRQVNSSVVLAPGETAYVAARRANAVSAWTAYFNNPALNLTGFDVNAILANTSNLPNVAFAVSGGGYRAMIHGNALFNGYDARNQTAVEQGTGGVLQLGTYMSGLSGGSWAVGAVAINSFPTTEQLHSIWNLSVNLVDPYGVVGDVEYYQNLTSEVQQKADAGFDITLTDYWGRALSLHLINNTNNGLGTTFSSVQNNSAFTDHIMPFPIIIADGRAPGQFIIPINSTIYEFTPYEFGSWHPTLRSFIPTEYIGTAAHNGQPNTTNVCVQGFDNAGFIMGTSATLFNTALLALAQSNKTLANLFGDTVTRLLGGDDDIASYPNTFNGINEGTYDSAREAELDLVDGGEDTQNIPLWPLLEPARQVDIIIAIDASADTRYFWPNGSSLVQTRNRVNSDFFKGQVAYPEVPSSPNTFINRRLNTHPTIFGCNATNLSIPIILYVPNHPYTAYTNFSTFQLEYDDDEVNAFINNGMHEASHNGTFATCLACTLTYRAMQRTGTDIPSVCTQCFGQYCWDGVEDNTTPSEQYNPSIPGVAAVDQKDGAETSQSPTPTPTSPTSSSSPTEGNGGCARLLSSELVGALGMTVVGVVLGLVMVFV